MIKYATLQVLSASYAHAGDPLMRTAHKASFSYDPKPGFLYVRSRAISSRTNDNFDTFPAPEIEKGWRSFIGKPVFVNHNNENHRRARGVIVDAALHKDANADGSPDTWVEVLMEVDAIHFPKLAQAIVQGHIERTSMGTDVDYSICSFCNNRAATPAEYCKHIPRLKGQRIRRTTGSGSTEDVLVSEICYGLHFFENSLLVEEPADPTAFFLGIDARGLYSEGERSADPKDVSEHWVKPYGGGQYAVVRKGETEPVSLHPSKGQARDEAARLNTTAVGIASETEYDPFAPKPGSGICPDCYGEGELSTLQPDGSWSEYETCKTCGGTGKERKEANVLRSHAAATGDGHVGGPSRTWVQDALQAEHSAGLHRIGVSGPQGACDGCVAERDRHAVTAGTLRSGRSPMSFGMKRVASIHKTAAKCSYCGTTVYPDAPSGDARYGGYSDADGDTICHGHSPDGKHHADHSAGHAASKLGYGEVVAPPAVDTMRADNCPICGGDAYDGDRCLVCGYEKPPDLYMDPDLEAAGLTDLRQEMAGGEQTNISEDSAGVVPDSSGNLSCPNCGDEFPDADGPQMAKTPPGPVQDAGTPPGTPAAPGQLPSGSPVDPDPTHMDPPTQPPGSAMDDAPPAPVQPDQTGNAPAPAPAKDGEKPDEPPAGETLPKPKKDETTDQQGAAPGAPKGGDDSAKQAPPTKGDDDSNPFADGSDPFGKGDDSKAPDASEEDGSKKPADATKPPESGDDATSAGDKPAPDATKGDETDDGSKPPKVNSDGSKPEDLPPAHEGDPCPSCGQGKLTKAQADAFNEEEDALQAGDETEKQVAQDADGAHFPGDTPDDNGQNSTENGTDSPPDDSSSDEQKPPVNGDDTSDDDEEKKKKQGKPLPWSKASALSNIHALLARGEVTSPEGVNSMAPRPVLAAVQEQQKVIDKQAAEIKWLYAAVNKLAVAAGLKPVTADDKNPAQPVPSPGAEAPYSTLQQERDSATRGDVAEIGGTPGATDVAADSTTTVDQIGGINADTPYNVSEDVTQPTEGTDGHRPLDEVRTRPRIEFGDPLKPDAAFPLQGEWANKSTVGSAARTFASLRLARLRLQAGVASGEDIVIAEEIQRDASKTDGAIAQEIDTLSAVVAAAGQRTAGRTAPRRLVPQAPAGVSRTTPSFTSTGTTHVASSEGFDDDAFFLSD